MAERRRRRRSRRRSSGRTEAAPKPKRPEEPARRPETIYPIHPASPFRRAYAATVDATILFVLFMSLALVVRGRFLSADAAPQDILLFFAYFVLFTGIKGQTPGKWVAGIIVVDREGRTPGVAVAIPREMVGKFVSTVSFGVGLAWMVFDKDRQGWHDKIAGTYVVTKTSAGAPGPFKALWRLGDRKD